MSAGKTIFNRRGAGKGAYHKDGYALQALHLMYLTASFQIPWSPIHQNEVGLLCCSFLNGFRTVARPDEGTIRAIAKQHLFHQQTGAAIYNKKNFVLHSSCCRPGMRLRHSCGTAEHTRASAGAGTDGLTSA